MKYDLIVTNPPYVDAEDMSDLPDEFRVEPELALAAGSDGLKLVRRILANAPDYMSEDAVLICEVGNSQVHLMAEFRKCRLSGCHLKTGVTVSLC